ncbi:MAG: hypothetical protein AAGF12_24460, partial [Myxococcota bacterium]
MRYLCVHCDKRFTHDEDTKPRCPECMRKNGLEVIPEEESGGRPKWLVPAVGIAVVGAVAGGYAYWAEETPDTVSAEVAFRPLERSELLGHVRRLRADVSDDQLELFAADEAIEDFASAAVEGQGSSTEKAEAVVEAIRARASKRAFRRWSLSSPRDTPVRDARRTMERLSEDGGRAKLYPLEVAAVAAAALRSEGVEAMLTEIYAFPEDQSPPDPSGHLGYYGIAVYPGEVGEGEPTIYDP